MGLRRTALAATVALLSALMPLAPITSAHAASCWARNITKGTQARSDLQRVLDAARAGDTIAVKSVCAGNFEVTKRLTLIGKPTASDPVPSLTAHGEGRVLRVTARLWLRDLRIEDGDVAGDGGGILVQGATLTLERVVVRGNSAASGGGIFTDRMLVIKASQISDNSATQNGGGVAVDTAAGSASVKGTSTVDGNTAGYAGGGLYAESGDLVLSGTASVTGNAGVWGGGAALWPLGTLTMKDSSSVAGNSATQSGGGIYSYGDDSAVTMLEGSMVSGNTADADDSGFGSGGGIYGGCGSYLTGAVGDANVDANHKGVASPVENNVHYIPCG